MVLGLLWANTSFANDHKPNNFDAFVWLDGKKIKIQKGRDIENPENKIIIQDYQTPNQVSRCWN